MKTAGPLFLTLMLGLSFMSAVPAQVVPVAPIKIICIGDSITQGGRAGREEYSYRLPLYRMLKQRGVSFDFIGTRQSGVDASFQWPADFDPDHEGFYGAKTAQIRDALVLDLPKLPPPDIAIIYTGWNDASDDFVKTMIPPLADLIGALRARNPDVKILVAQKPGIWSSLRMHFEVWRLARRLNTARSPIVTVPLYLDWDPTADTFDGGHPNVQGQAKIAQRFFSALEPMLPPR